MRVILKNTVILAGIAVLTACSAETNLARSFYSEAGSEVDEGGFGNPTMNNIQVQTGQKSHVIDLSNRFASEVPATVNFAFNSSQLDDSARSALRRQADWIRQFPEIRFRVYGHTDLVGSNSYNYALGLRRAKAVVSYLANQGIGRDRLEALVSYGETQPLVVSTSEEMRNRRTVTEVSGFVQSHPSVLNGKYAAVIFRDYVASAVEKSTLSGNRNSVVQGN